MVLGPAFKIIQWNRKGRKQICLSGLYDSVQSVKEYICESADESFIGFEESEENENLIPAVTYKESDSLYDILNEWAMNHEADENVLIDQEIERKCWTLTTDQADAFETVLQKIEEIYILTDHRKEELKDKEIRIFPERGIRIYPAANLLKDLNGLSVKAFLGAVRFHFDIMIMPEGYPCLPMEEHCMGMYVEGQWYHLEMKTDLYQHTEGQKEKTDVEIMVRKLYQMIFRSGNLSEHIMMLPGNMKAKDTQVQADTCGGAVILFYPLMMSKLLLLMKEENRFEQKVFDVDRYLSDPKICKCVE